LKRNQISNSILLILVLIPLAGCGFKGNPSPYPVLPDRKPAIKNMEALSSGEAVILKWNFQDKNGLINYIGIERSEAGTIGNECKDCPRTYTRIGQIPVKAVKPEDKELRMLSFTDNKVMKDKIYDYRLMLCEGNENCSEAAKVKINYQ
jgi:hypothetical protein